MAEQQPEQMQYIYPQQVQPPFQQHPDVIKDTLQPTDIMQRIEKALSGKKWNSKTNSYEPDKEFKPLMNGKGVNDIMRLCMDPRVNRVFFLTYYDTIEIGKSMKNLMDIMVDLFIENCSDYEMQENQIPAVLRLINDIVNASYNRAAGGREGNHVYGVVDVRQGAWAMPTQSDRKSIFGRMGGK